MLVLPNPCWHCGPSTLLFERTLSHRVVKLFFHLAYWHPFSTKNDGYRWLFSCYKKHNLQRTLSLVQTTSWLADPSAMVLILWFYVVIRFLNIKSKRKRAWIYVYTLCRSKASPLYIIVLSHACLHAAFTESTVSSFQRVDHVFFRFFFIPLSGSRLDIVELQKKRTTTWALIHSSEPVDSLWSTLAFVHNQWNNTRFPLAVAVLKTSQNFGYNSAYFLNFLHFLWSFLN